MSHPDHVRSQTIETCPFVTTNQGVKVSDDLNSLKAGERGPTLLEDFILREKITHFDHERIPERIVHARGAGAHGFFECYESQEEFTKAAFLQKAGKRTPVFVRFSTVAGSRGSSDMARDARGFAVKFYTEEGIWDLVGNNIPVFFIQDAMQFPDFVHSVKAEPNNEIPQAASAHSTFWDFVSLTPESSHMLMWVMSPRAIPRSFSTMEGFGVNTFRLVNSAGNSFFVKFQFKPLKGVRSVVWDEAQTLSGKDPDFHRRDLWESIETGDFPEYEFGYQIVPEADELKYPFDLLDPTKVVPEEIVPFRKVGKLVLNKNPENFFAETEQVAFCPTHLVPGIEFSNDPLLQGRLFSYIDTQISRVGPNFAQIPINRPKCPQFNNQRDGKAQMDIHKGRVSYFPNSIAGGLPTHSPEARDAFRSFPEAMSGQKIRQRSPSFKDHFSQATMFWNSMSNWEKQQIIDAFSFELNNCDLQAIKERVVEEILANIHPDLAGGVAQKLGYTIKNHNDVPKPPIESSPALSMNKPAPSIKGQKVAILADDGVDSLQVKHLMKSLTDLEAVVHVIATHGGSINVGERHSIEVKFPLTNAPSVFYDAVIIPEGSSLENLKKSGMALHFIRQAYAHCKTIGVIGAAEKTLLPTALHPLFSMHGIIVGNKDGMKEFITEFVEAMKKHRHFDRNISATQT